MSASQKLGIPYKKPFYSAYLNPRVLRGVVQQFFFGMFPLLRERYSYYTNISDAKRVAARVLLEETSRPAIEQLGVQFSNETREYMVSRNERPPSHLSMRFETTEHHNILFLGHTGTAVDPKLGCILQPTVEKGRLRNFIKAKHLRLLEGDAGKIYLPMMGVHKGHKQYFHFFGDYMVELYQYLFHLYDGTQALVLVTRNDLSAGQRETYQALKMRYPKLEVLELGPNQALNCPTAHIPCYQTDGKIGVFISSAYADFLRNLFSDFYRFSPVKAGHRLYISRNDAKKRHLLNEAELLPILEEKGFDVITTGNLPLREQIALFREAKYIVTTHGAGMTNLLFAPPGAKILELASQDYGACFFLWISAVCGIEHHVLIGSKEKRHQHFSCDVHRFRRALDALVGKER